MNYGYFSFTLHRVACISLVVAAGCALVIIVDEMRRPQKIWIMNLVWPLTALFGSAIWLAGYYLFGRNTGQSASKPRPSMLVMAAKGASHCGAGCTLGDIIAEWLAFGVPSVAVWFGWRTLFNEKSFAVWILDFVLAFAIGIAFQYFTIKPMRHLSPRRGLAQALKADIASISAWQLGMYGVMALTQLVWFRHSFGRIAPVDSVEFWFAMQLSMLAGFVTSLPVNWLLIRSGVKDAM